MQVQAKDLEEEDKGNCVGDMKAEDRHLLDTTGLPFFFKSFLWTEEEEKGQKIEKET